jgi:hypothetical protein
VTCVNSEFRDSLLDLGCFAGSMVGPSDDTELHPLLLKIGSLRWLDTMVWSEPLVWLFSPAWDVVILTLDVGFICPFVVIDPAD